VRNGVGLGSPEIPNGREGLQQAGIEGSSYVTPLETKEGSTHLSQQMGSKDCDEAIGPRFQGLDDMRLNWFADYLVGGSEIS